MTMRGLGLRHERQLAHAVRREMGLANPVACRKKFSVRNCLRCYV